MKLAFLDILKGVDSVDSARDLQDLEKSQDMQDLHDLQNTQNSRDSQNIYDLQNIQTPQNMRDLQDLHDAKRRPASPKHLLGFSGGADSIALFYALVEHSIAFDIAIVDYGLRAQSKEEVAYAHKLAASHDKRCFSAQAPAFKSNFEANARAFRYRFFASLIATLGYDSLLLAHHFNDRFEWFLLQLSKGAGISSLLGFEPISWVYPDSFGTLDEVDLADSADAAILNSRILDSGIFQKSDSTSLADCSDLADSATLQKQPALESTAQNSAPFRIIRPLFQTPKDEILAFCAQKGAVFFEDSTNNDERYARNFMRKHFSNKFIELFGGGLMRSFEILACERATLYQGRIENLGALTLIIAPNELSALHHIARVLKMQGYVLSQKQREEICKSNFSCEIGGGRANNASACHASTGERVGFFIERMELDKIYAKRKNSTDDKNNADNTNASSAVLYTSDATTNASRAIANTNDINASNALDSASFGATSLRGTFALIIAKNTLSLESKKPESAPESKKLESKKQDSRTSQNSAESTPQITMPHTTKSSQTPSPAKLPKSAKNLARIYSIPPRIRPFCAIEASAKGLDIEAFFKLLHTRIWALYQQL